LVNLATATGWKTDKVMSDYPIELDLLNPNSNYVDYQDDKLYYSNPVKIFDFCKTTLSGRVVLRHEYQTKPNLIPFEYTIYVYKD